MTSRIDKARQAARERLQEQERGELSRAGETAASPSGTSGAIGHSTMVGTIGLGSSGHAREAEPSASPEHATGAGQHDRHPTTDDNRSDR